MLRDSFKKMAGDFGYKKIAEEAAVDAQQTDLDNVEKEVINKLDRSVKMDEVDTVTFGLETDDGKIVKVYVNADQADDFERALSDKLGEVDDIEEALNELSKEYEIVDVEWPEDEEKTDDEDSDLTDGSEVMDPKVYKSKEEGAGDEPTIESMNAGEKFTMMLEADSTSIESRLTTAAQLLVYNAILELGIPEIALNRNPYRAAIVKGIRDTAFNLNKNSQMKIALKMFVKRANDILNQKEAPEEQEDEGNDGRKPIPKKDDKKKPEPKKHEKHDDKKKDVKEELFSESLELMEGVSQDFWSGFKAIVNYASPDQGLSDALLNSSRMEQLMARSSSTLTTRVPQVLRSKLSDLMDELKLEAEKKGTVTESATIDEIGSLLKSMLVLADSSDGARMAGAITSSSQWNQLMAKMRISLSTKFAGGARNKLNMVKQAIANAEALMAKKAPAPQTATESKIVEEVQEWTFEKGGDDLKIGCNLLKFTLDAEEAEKLSKGVSNRDAVVVKDVEGNKKYVFSPRGVNGIFKQVGQTATYNITSKDLEKLLDATVEKSGKDEEEDKLKEDRNQITFHQSGAGCIVQLEKKTVGEIRKVAGGYQYYPQGSGGKDAEPGEVFTTLRLCKNDVLGEE